MKKFGKSYFLSSECRRDMYNDAVFEPDDNLYNDPLDGEISTIARKVKGQKTLKNNKIVSKNEK